MFWITTNDTLEFFKRVCWLIGFVLNIMILATYKLNEAQGKEDMGERRLTGDNWEVGINIAGFCFAFFALVLLLIWVVFKMSVVYQLQVMTYYIQHPSRYLQKLDFSTKFDLLVSGTLLGSKHATNFFLHIVFALMGTYVDAFFHTLHLLLWFNISDAANYILQAFTKRINTLF